MSRRGGKQQNVDLEFDLSISSLIVSCNGFLVDNSSARYDENVHEFAAEAKIEAQVLFHGARLVGERLEGRGSP